MSMTDPIADLLTRIRNGQAARKSEIRVASSKLKVAITKVLKEEGYIEDFRVEERRPYPVLTIKLKYTRDRRHAIRELRRISKPGLRVYAGKDEIPRVRNGLGIAIVSTPQGVMSGHEARRRGIGGEVLCTVF